MVKAAFWMVGWLACMLVMAVAGRETTRELNVFQVMMMRSLIGLVMLYPLVHLNGGLRTMRTQHPWRHLARNIAHDAPATAPRRAATMLDPGARWRTEIADVAQ